MKKILFFTLVVFLAVLLIIGKKHQDNESKYLREGSDGYSFHEKQIQRTNFKIKLMTYSSFQELRDKASSLGIKDSEYIMGFTDVGLDSCTIYTVDPSTAGYYPEFLGHELYHCMYGQWHVSNDQK